MTIALDDPVAGTVVRVGARTTRASWTDGAAASWCRNFEAQHRNVLAAYPSR
jgi:hypothetical protein